MECWVDLLISGGAATCPVENTYCCGISFIRKRRQEINEKECGLGRAIICCLSRIWNLKNNVAIVNTSRS